MRHSDRSASGEGFHEPATAVNEAVSALIGDRVRTGDQTGIQVAAVADGEVVVDTWGGTMGPRDPRPVDPRTLFGSFSVTKGVASVAVAQLVERGLIDPDEAVATYWPEFAGGGKSEVIVAQALSHQAGLHTMPHPFAVTHLTDREGAMRRVESGVPAWEPGTAVGYHGVTWGWIVDGLVAAVTGSDAREAVRAGIAAPLGIEAEMSIGVAGATDDRERLATLEIVPAGEGLDLPADSEFLRAMSREMWAHFASDEVRRACLPSANGHFTARALARLYGALARGGEIDGVRVVSPDALAEATRIRARGTDRVLGVPMRYALGFQLGGTIPGPDGEAVHGAFGPAETTFGHGGAGGSTAFADPVRRLGVAVTLNRMAYPPPGRGTTVEICDLIRSMV